MRRCAHLHEADKAQVGAVVVGLEVDGKTGLLAQLLGQRFKVFQRLNPRAGRVSQ